MKRLIALIIMMVILTALTGCSSTEDLLSGLAIDYASISTQSDKDLITKRYQQYFAPEGLRALTDIVPYGTNDSFRVEEIWRVYNKQTRELTMLFHRNNSVGYDTISLVYITFNKEKKITSLELSHYYPI